MECIQNKVEIFDLIYSPVAYKFFYDLATTKTIEAIDRDIEALEPSEEKSYVQEHVLSFLKMNRYKDCAYDAYDIVAKNFIDNWDDATHELAELYTDYLDYELYLGLHKAFNKVLDKHATEDMLKHQDIIQEFWRHVRAYPGKNPSVAECISSLKSFRYVLLSNIKYMKPGSEADMYSLINRFVEDMLMVLAQLKYLPNTGLYDMLKIFNMVAFEPKFTDLNHVYMCIYGFLKAKGL